MAAKQTPTSELRNWADRVSKEASSSKEWEHDWGSLYTPNTPADYEGKIKALEETLKAMPGSSSYRTQSQADYQMKAPIHRVKAFIR